MTEQKTININEIAEEIKKNNSLEMYWNYNDKLTDEQIIKIIKEEDGLNDVENELYEYNQDYIYEEIINYIKEYLEENNLNLSEEEQEDLMFECQEKYKFNIDDLIKNSKINIRVTLQSDEDMIYYNGWEKTDTIKQFKKRFKGHFKLKDLKTEFNELMNDYANLTFFFKLSGDNILKFREQFLKGKITLKKGLQFGLFNSFVGGGSVLEIPLLKEITLNLKDWRFNNIKEEILNSLEKYSDYGYYSVEIKADNLNKYGIQEVYNLTSDGWKEF